MHSCGVRTLFIIFIGTPKRAPRVQLSTIPRRVSNVTQPAHLPGGWHRVEAPGRMG